MEFPLAPSPGTTEQSPALPPLLPPIRHLFTWRRSPSAFSRPSSLSSQPALLHWMLQSLHHPLVFLDLLLVSWAGEPRAGPSREEGPPPSQLKRLFAFFATRAQWWLTFSCVSTSAPRTFSFQLGSPQQILVHGIAPPQEQDMAFPFADLREVLVNPFLQPGTIPLTPPGVISHSPSLCIISKSPRAYSALPSWSSTGHSSHLQGKPPVLGHQLDSTLLTTTWPGQTLLHSRYLS